MTELTAEDEKDLVECCMESKNTRLALAVGQIQAELRGSHESHAEETMMTELMDEEKEFLVDYCMKPENTWLALAIGQIQATLEKRIVFSFLEKLDESVKRKLRECSLRWRVCIPKRDLEEEDLKKEFTILYVMTMEDQGIEIHLGLCNWQNMKDRVLYVGTHKKIKGIKIPWPKEKLADFLEEQNIWNDCHRHWWFDPIDMHRSIVTIEALSTLDDGPKIEYFTAKLVYFAESISSKLEE